MQIGEKAVKAIIGFEISSEAYYNEALQHPVWPRGASGVTIGIGYDLGEHTAAQFEADWAKVLPTDSVKALATMAGMKGDGARIRLSSVRACAVPYSAAISVFSNVTLPKYAAMTAEVMPNCSYLQPDAFGALVSLSYNRGPRGWKAPGSEFKEMRLIHAAMLDKDFSDIPNQIRAMNRLWLEPDGNAKPGMAGVIARRTAEANLFETAQANAPAAPAAPAATPAPQTTA